MKKKTLALLAAAAVLVAVAIWFTSRPEPLTVALATVDRGEIRATVSNTRAGTVEACDRARLAPILGGQIASLPVAEGDPVEAGQILMELWNDDVRAQVLLAEEELAAARSRANESCTSADVAKREARRLRQLREQNLVSEEAVDAAEGKAKALASGCRAMRSMIDVSRAKITAATAALERTILRAPFAGTVAEINGEIGEIVTPSPVGVPTPPAVDLIDNTCIYVTAPIDEVDAPEIRAGMPAMITLDAFADRSFPATVRRVAPYVLDLEKQARTVDIEAEFDEPSADLLPGYSADVEVLLDINKDALRIPSQALMEGDRVLVLDADGVLAEKSVSTGLRNWQFTEIVDGLAEGDKIVLSIDREGVEAGASAVPDDE